MEAYKVSGNIVDIVNRRIFPGTIAIQKGKIASIAEEKHKDYPHFILPGFIDAHIHIESSMLIPSEFARLAVLHGTVATVSDPHEIGNVLGVEGVRYMIRNGKQVPFHFYFGAPSCVPATAFETAGATITKDDIRLLLKEDGLKYLSEMMNYPAVLGRDPLVMDKIQAAKDQGKPVDGHAPGLRGEDARRYISAGISTDHECYSLDEALDKVNAGMHIIIREGSAAKNYEALHSLIKTHPGKVMFCSDDKHPHELVEGHINDLVKRSIAGKGHDVMDVLRCACYNPREHYGLDVGLLREGDPADFIVADNLRDLNILQTYINGVLVAEKGKTLIDRVQSETINNFQIGPNAETDFSVKPNGSRVRVIETLDGQLITTKTTLPATVKNDNLVSNLDHDALKIVVVNRYNKSPPAIGFIKNFGLKQGALASCIAHDCHNIIAVGVTDAEICAAVNAIIANKGGISVALGGEVHVLPLPVAGIMTNEDGFVVAEKYTRLDSLAKQLGTKLHAPFMTLSFMALLVIPSLKLSDKGLFDGDSFNFVDLSF